MEKAELFVYILIGGWILGASFKSWPVIFFVSLGGLGYTVLKWSYLSGYNLSHLSTSGGRYGSSRGGSFFTPEMIAIMCIGGIILALAANKNKKQNDNNNSGTSEKPK
ncbi:MAG: hypothetical protein LBI01_05810 [Elusimicrobium sp.]|jgi:hypothetical protein|nr:hypothetical protein [Elusimicrobium sp.]